MKCPTCKSPSPELHPAVQHEGEVETCVDEFHLRLTPMNHAGYVSMVKEKRIAKGLEP
jgi:hypothetical protein